MRFNRVELNRLAWFKIDCLLLFGTGVHVRYNMNKIFELTHSNQPLTLTLPLTKSNDVQSYLSPFRFIPKPAHKLK